MPRCKIVLYRKLYLAEMAKLVDAEDLKSSEGDFIPVRVRFPAPDFCYSKNQSRRTLASLRSPVLLLTCSELKSR